MYSLNESLAFLLNRAGAAVSYAFLQELKNLSLTMPMWRVLAALWSNGDQSLASLAELTSVEMSTLSRQVATLVKGKLVSRGRSAVDWRSVNITLTTRGRSVVEQLLPVVERHERAAFAGISAVDARRLRLLLNKVHANIISSDEVRSIELTGDGEERRT